MSLNTSITDLALHFRLGKNEHSFMSSRWHIFINILTINAIIMFFYSRWMTITLIVYADSGLQLFVGSLCDIERTWHESYISPITLVPHRPKLSTLTLTILPVLSICSPHQPNISYNRHCSTSMCKISIVPYLIPPQIPTNINNHDYIFCGRNVSKTQYTPCKFNSF